MSALPPIENPKALVLSRTNMDNLAERIEQFRGYSGVFQRPFAVVTPLKQTYMMRSPLAICWLYDAATEYFESGLTSIYRHRVEVAAAHEVEVDRMAPSEGHISTASCDTFGAA